MKQGHRSPWHLSLFFKIGYPLFLKFHVNFGAICQFQQRPAIIMKGYCTEYANQFGKFCHLNILFNLSWWYTFPFIWLFFISNIFVYINMFEMLSLTHLLWYSFPRYFIPLMLLLFMFCFKFHFQVIFVNL